MMATSSTILQPRLLFRAALLAWSGALLAAVLAAPLAAAAGWPEAWFLYEAFEPFCHQQPERSWRIQGLPLAVCSRCLGVYSGLLLVALSGVGFRARTLAIGMGLLGLSWVVEFAGLVAVSATMRLVTGLVVGCAAGGLLLARLTTPTRKLRPPLADARGSD